MKTITEIRKEIRQKFNGDAECNFVMVGDGPWILEVSTHNLILGQGYSEPDAWRDAEKQCREAIWIESTRTWITKDMANENDLSE